LLEELILHIRALVLFIFEKGSGFSLVFAWDRDLRVVFQRFGIDKDIGIDARWTAQHIII
jgi:hypothetical protein